jgi:tRNA(Ile)-lysidine synthase
VLRDAALMAGCPHGALTAGHIDRVDALVTGWRGQRWVDLPGGVRARRRDGKVWFTSTAVGTSLGEAKGGESVGRK